MSFKDHFSNAAAAYAAARPTYPDELFRFIAEQAPGRRLVWDCATGSGQAARDLARYFERVVATDASETQIAHAPATEGVEYRVGGADHSGLADRSADAATAAAAVHWLDFDAFYAEVRRVVAPGGLLAVWCYGSLVLPPPLGDMVHEFEYGTMWPYWPPERRYVAEGYRTIPFPFHEVDGPRLDVRANYTLPQLLGYLNSWSATNRHRQEVGGDPVRTLGEQLAEVWGTPSEAREARWPLHMRVGRVD